MGKGCCLAIQQLFPIQILLDFRVGRSRDQVLQRAYYKGPGLVSGILLYAL